MITAYSTPAGSTLRDLIADRYGILMADSPRLYMSGVNDIYMVEAVDPALCAPQPNRFVFKLYRHGWRTEGEVRYELEFLHHLDRKGVPVSLPVMQNNGLDEILKVDTPEGTRVGVLYTYAPGKPPSWPFYADETESRLMGAALGAIHCAGADFTSEQPRVCCIHDERRLIDGALAAAEPVLKRRSRNGQMDEWLEFVGLIEALRARLRQVTVTDAAWGMCHGDYHCGNLFLTDRRRVTAYDFDVCGPGWLAFDLARWKANCEGKPTVIWEAFLDGYRSRHVLPPGNPEPLIDLFVVLRLLDWMQIKLGFIARGEWGDWDLNFFLNDLFTSLRAYNSTVGS